MPGVEKGSSFILENTGGKPKKETADDEEKANQARKRGFIVIRRKIKSRSTIPMEVIDGL